MTSFDISDFLYIKMLIIHAISLTLTGAGSEGLTSHSYTVGLENIQTYRVVKDSV